MPGGGWFGGRGAAEPSRFPDSLQEGEVCLPSAHYFPKKSSLSSELISALTFVEIKELFG